MNMPRAQSILIFLPDGSPRSVRIAELTNRSVKAVLFPRNKLDYVGQRDEVKNVGIYFLFGESSDEAKPVVYIGEAEDCYTRLKKHNREKDFWQYGVVIVSKSQAFTKIHIRYLEYLAVKMATEANRFVTENSQIPTEPFVTEPMEADLLDNFDSIKILLSTLGFPIFDTISRQSVAHRDVLIIAGRGVRAEGDLIDDGFVVFKGSQATLETVPSCHEYMVALRTKLLHSGVLVRKDNYLEFVEDYVFNSPSTAGGVVLGRSTNGWKKWKSKVGKTLDELKRQSL